MSCRFVDLNNYNVIINHINLKNGQLNFQLRTCIVLAVSVADISRVAICILSPSVSDQLLKIRFVKFTLIFGVFYCDIWN